MLLSPAELQLLTQLETRIRTGFVLRGEALATIRRQKLYREDYDSFQEYCTATFGFTPLYIKRCIKAASTYRQIESYLKTNGLSDPLPSKQRQLRPIFQAPLTLGEFGLVWTMAVTLAMGEVPSFSIVKDAVKSYLQSKNPPLNPFVEGQVCRIKGISSKRNCWCIISEVRGNECFVSTWDSEYILSFDDLEAIPTDDNQQEAFLNLGERMTALFETGELDAAAMWVLKGLEKLDRSSLNSLEERLLQVLEDELL